MWESEEENPFQNFTVSEANYFLSALGNAQHSGMDLTLLFECGLINQTGETFDAGVSAAIEAHDWLQSFLK